MINISSLGNKIRKFLNRFRLRWEESCFFLIGNLQQAKLSQLVPESTTVLGIMSKLLAGWYMLEVQVRLPTARVLAHVHSVVGGADDDSLVKGFPLYSGRKCKRLVHLRSVGELYLAIQIAPNDCEVQHLRLVRVTEKFARSRMLTRLRALHPRYKTNFDSYRPGTGSKEKLSTLSVVWSDYCSLFEGDSEIEPYTSWVLKFDSSSDEARHEILAQIEGFLSTPMVSVLMPVHNPNHLWLEKAIASVRAQSYSNWQLCIADDASADPAIHTILARYAKEDRRINVVFREKNGHISAASNSALDEARGEWIALLDQDDELAEHAFFWVVNQINRYPECRMIYSDEDKIDEAGIRSDAYFKCDWNVDLFYSQNMFSHLGVYHAELMREVGGFRLGLEGSQDYDLALRCIERIAPEQIQHVARVLYHWRMHLDSTAHSSDAKPYAMVAAERALNEHLARRGVNATAESLRYGYRVRYALPDSLPMVSLIIPTRNSLKLLRKCVESILGKTSYPRYELVIIDNDSDDPDTLRYLEELDAEPRIKVLRDKRPFNYSALNNAAVKFAQGEIIGLVNNDVEVINSDWLSEMVSHVLRGEVGAVGARLWYPDDTIQHAGVVLGVHGIAGHAHRFLPRDHVGYCGRATLIQSYSAVTAACLLVRKPVYEALAGLNEIELQVTCNDVDFCLRLREAGYRIIWTPYAELYHHESATRGFDDTPEKRERGAREIAYMKQRWGDALLRDPAYSPNLSLDGEDFGLAWPPRVASFVPNLVTLLPIAHSQNESLPI
ncbi:MAG TPA: glycosyltransferase family 2 protein [Anaerovoracaceae bacterium]|nr:glycosyltransferase family 2 protein [Anaerovoracaceae bacterium]